MRLVALLWLVAGLAVPGVAVASGIEGDARRGAQAFRQCVACHALEPGVHLTGPSLANVVGRPAAAAPGFRRYSEALQASGLTWNPATLDRWLAGPSALVPGTSMRVAPIEDPGIRRDLIAFLGSAAEEDLPSSGGGMMGAMQGGRMLDLKDVEPNQRVTSIGYCGDAYHVTLGTGRTYTFWEFNLRFKTDSSSNGPPPGEPVIVAAGMQGDRAQVVFADPGEISAFIARACPGG